MNREIKFRAWTGTRMMDNTDFCDDYLEWGQGRIRAILPDYYGDSRKEEIPLMQFTGLKDKNGKEIYEGDILSESIYDIPAVYLGEEISVIVFRFSAFRKVLKDRYTTMDVKGKFGEIYQGELLETYGGILDNLQNIEVIGNIYENPELLK